ncbi:Rrf2 family transcriptional regulator [Acetilactobacillus jinshanensis]|uniref:Rrf2 family transcriptional regulator n=1 Tax=Acetilactobacillus jinshanensis TaxID=1720083 RepID=A0A4P6ZKK3_9LACO|nr:Rrf2 family transcriptional regulator [Acetilactobacillus jinshanensis]QBP18188.1 Rrf2 family transcriptional regulator [Acetilactobacillus jinshanensis]URL61056.1 Rrf2 family transcriptional regulator [uncultured bacterium]
MKYSHKLSDAVHVLTYIYVCRDYDLSSKTIAASVESNPSLIRRLLSKLTKAGLVASKPGIASRKLTRSPKQISLLDVYNALGGGQLLHIDKKTNPRCIVGGNIQTVLNRVYDKVQNAAEHEMDQITLADIIDQVLKEHRLKHRK